MTSDIAYGAELRKRREALYLTRAEGAAVAGVSAPSIWLWEAGALPAGRKGPALSRWIAALERLEEGQP